MRFVNMNHRVFFAIKFPLEIQNIMKNSLKILHNHLSKTDVHWTPFYNLHITLGFLGNVLTEHIQVLIENAYQELRHTQPFLLHIEKLQLFPDTKKPRVIVYEIAYQETLINLVAALQEAIRATGYKPEERAFRGHLTLGRLRNDVITEENLENVELATIPPINITQIELLESRLGNGPPRYTSLAKFDLRL